MKELLKNLARLQAIEFDEAKENNPDAITAELRGKIPAPILAHYDRLAARGKKGIVPVLNQVCAGCHMRLPIAVIATLMHGTDVQLCDSCGRYLYLPEPKAAAAEPAAEPKKTRKPRKRSAAALA